MSGQTAFFSADLAVCRLLTCFSVVGAAANLTTATSLIQAGVASATHPVLTQVRVDWLLLTVFLSVGCTAPIAAVMSAYALAGCAVKTIKNAISAQTSFLKFCVTFEVCLRFYRPPQRLLTHTPHAYTPHALQHFSPSTLVRLKALGDPKTLLESFGKTCLDMVSLCSFPSPNAALDLFNGDAAAVANYRGQVGPAATWLVRNIATFIEPLILKPTREFNSGTLKGTRLTTARQLAKGLCLCLLAIFIVSGRTMSWQKMLIAPFNIMISQREWSTAVAAGKVCVLP